MNTLEAAQHEFVSQIDWISSALNACRSSPRTISTGQLKTLLPLHIRPIYLIVYEGSYQINSVGDLILRLASRLDAFSAYPSRT